MESLKPTRTQVIIIGAGPTGLSMAVQLLRYGIDFILLEKNEKTTPLSKAVVVQARTLEIFEELGLAAKALEQGRITNALNMFYKGKRRAAIDLSGLGQGISRFPFALSLEQSKTEKLLAGYLTENNVKIHWKSGFSHLQQDDHGVTAFYTDADGKQTAVRGQYLIGADGAGSLVRHQLGLSFEGDTVPKIFYVADVTLKSTVINKDELLAFVIRKGFILFFPMEGQGHYRIVGILPDGDASQELEFSGIENSIIENVGVPLEFKDLKWFSSYKVHSRKAGSFRSERCFIAGDAAHIHTPAGGQGMNTGIQDAYNLAWKMALTLKGGTKPEILETYNTERQENARNLLRSTDRMFDILAGTNPFWDFIRLTVFPVFAGLITRSAWVKRRIFPLISQTGIAYPSSKITVPGKLGKVRSGSRMPYFLFNDGSNIYDFLKEPKFKLLSFGKAGQGLEVAAQKQNILLEFLHFEEIPQKIFGREKDFHILLRPDNHISYIGKDSGKIIDFLNDITLGTEKFKV